MAGLFDFLGGGQAQGPGAMQQQNPLQRLLDPQVALPMAAALLGNQGNMQNFGNAFGAAGKGLAEQKLTAQTNKTGNWLRKQDQRYAEMLDNGFQPADVFKIYQEERKAQAPSYMNLGDGSYLNQNTGEVLTAPGGSQKAPQVVELFDEASGQPYKATWDAETGQYQRVGGVKARSGMQLTTNPDGTVSLTEGPLSNRPKLTEGEAKNAGFLERVNKSAKVLDALEGEGTSLFNKTLGNVPVAGNYMRSQNAQKYDQAKRDFVNAILRRESGAVISDQEFANAEQQYFPQPGDGPDVIAQKRQNREAARKGLDIGAGQGAGMVSPPDGAVIDYTDFFGGQ